MTGEELFCDKEKTDLGSSREPAWEPVARYIAQLPLASEPGPHGIAGGGGKRNKI